MKKLFLAISTIFLVLFGVMTFSVSAERYTELPITMNQSRYTSTTMFTMSDFEIYVTLNETPQYTKTAYAYIAGDFVQGSSMDLSFHCYDASGNYLTTITDTMYSFDFEDFDDGVWCEFELTIPDVTATIEIATTYPGSWSNTYLYCKYMNVYSEDGRSIGIHDLLLPVYEICGWYKPVAMYSLSGEYIEVPCYDVSAYQKVGWYLWEDYYYLQFTQIYERLSRQGDYYGASIAVDNALAHLTGTYYESSIYGYKTNLIDSWRKKINGPLAYCTHSVNTSDNELSIAFKNVSYKHIDAFKIQFECYDVFGVHIKNYTSYYYCDDAELPSGEEKIYYWDGIPSNTKYVKNIRITQVVYSDGTSWYK